MDRGLGILKVGITGEQYNFYVRKIFKYEFGHRKAVGFRHFDIGNDDIDMVMPEKLNGLQAVAGRSRHFTADGVPIHKIRNAFAHSCLIIYDQ